MNNKVLLNLLALIFVSLNLNAKTVNCIAELREKLKNVDQRTAITKMNLIVSSKQPNMLNFVKINVKKTFSDIPESEMTYAFNVDSKNIQPYSDQKAILGSWKGAIGYVVFGEGCFGSSFSLVMPTNLHRLAKGVKFRSQIEEKIKGSLDCVVID